MYIIEAYDIWKKYLLGKVPVYALKGVNVKIKKANITMVLGPSGSGKSTLLHILGALDKASKGKVIIKGKDISKMNDYELSLFRRKELGFIFQSFNLIPTLNVLENVLVPTIPSKEYYKKKDYALKLIKEVSLENRINHKPSELSGGERQRVAIARALINNPDIVFADEPTGNLDSKTGKQIIDLILKLRDEEKKTFVIVTHDTSLVKYADEIIRIKDGKIMI